MSKNVHFIEIYYYYKQDWSILKQKNDDLYKYTMGNFSIDLGYERHFNLGKRLDAYLGGRFTKIIENGI